MRPFSIKTDKGDDINMNDIGRLLIRSGNGGVAWVDLTPADVRKLRHQFEVVAADASLED